MSLEVAVSVPWTFESRVHFRTNRHGRKRLAEGDAPAPPPQPLGSVPRVSKLLALAHRFQGLVDSGEVRDLAELARLGGVTRARVTQIMGLLQLAPDIQEAVLDLPRTVRGRDPVTERDLRPVVAEPEWERQREVWLELLRSMSSGPSLCYPRGQRLHRLLPGHIGPAYVST